MIVAFLTAVAPTVIRTGMVLASYTDVSIENRCPKFRVDMARLKGDTLKRGLALLKNV
jgi:hypothetical protein